MSSLIVRPPGATRRANDQRISSRAGTKVEHSLTGVQVRDGGRDTAAQ